MGFVSVLYNELASTMPHRKPLNLASFHMQRIINVVVRLLSICSFGVLFAVVLSGCSAGTGNSAPTPILNSTRTSLPAAPPTTSPTATSPTATSRFPATLIASPPTVTVNPTGAPTVGQVAISPVTSDGVITTIPVHFAVIGDYGAGGQAELDVSKLVKSWNPDFIITTGDNNYPSGESSTIDANIGQYYCNFIYPYMGTYCTGTLSNRFFPTLGNHDWDTLGAQPYLNYFILPNNERYYDFARGPVHFFVIDSDPREPDGISSTSTQAAWLHDRLSAATERWKLVYMHHPPYSSGPHGSTTELQWPYQQWGASAVLAGHDHDYERVVLDGFPYFVDGLGGAENIYSFGPPVPGSVTRYNDDYGAMLIDASDSSITFSFYSGANILVDTYAVSSATPTP
jgi:hypothetical protein